MSPPSDAPADLASLLSSVARQQNPQHYQTAPPSQTPQPAPFGYQPSPGQGAGAGAGQAYPSAGQSFGLGATQNVQNIMQQLARWKQ